MGFQTLHFCIFINDGVVPAETKGCRDKGFGGLLCILVYVSDPFLKPLPQDGLVLMMMMMTSLYLFPICLLLLLLFRAIARTEVKRRFYD